MTDISVPFIAGLAERFTQETLVLCEDAGLSAFEHAVALAVAAEHAQLTLKREGAKRGGTEDDWQAYCELRDGYSARTKRAVNGADLPFCTCGRRLDDCDGSRAGCTGQTGMPGVRDTKHPCDMFSPGKPTNGGCRGDGHYLCGECGLFTERSES